MDCTAGLVQPGCTRRFKEQLCHEAWTLHAFFPDPCALSRPTTVFLCQCMLLKCRKWMPCCRSTSMSWSAALSSHWTADTSAAWQQQLPRWRLEAAAVAHRLAGALGVPGG